MSHQTPAWSPYQAFYDNPIDWSNSLREDNYSVDEVNLEEETNDDFEN